MEKVIEYKEFIKHLCYESGKIIKTYFRQPVKIETKGDSSPVTIADKKAEQKLRELIGKEFPQHGILGEEFGHVNPDAKYQWVLDPIDGTKSFISGALSFGTLIGLLKNGKPVLGVFFQPVLNELLIGDNQICTLNDQKVTFRPCKAITEATLLITDYLDIKRYQDIKAFDKLAEQVNLFRSWGDCYGYYLLASGYADIMIDPVMNPWDVLPLIPIIQGAGGIITDYQGNDAVRGKSAVAAAREIHSRVISILNP